MQFFQDLITNEIFSPAGCRVIYHGRLCPQDCERGPFDTAASYVIGDNADLALGTYYDVWCGASNTWWLARVV